MDMLERTSEHQVPEPVLCQLVRTGILETTCIAIRNPSRALCALQKHTEEHLEPELHALSVTKQAYEFDDKQVAKV